MTKVTINIDTEDGEPEISIITTMPKADVFKEVLINAEVPKQKKVESSAEIKPTMEGSLRIGGSEKKDMIEQCDAKMSAGKKNNIKELINKKISKLFKRNNKINEANVAFFEGAKGNPKNQFCRIRLSIKGNDLFVTKNPNDYEKSISLAVDALRKMMRRKKSDKIS